MEKRNDLEYANSQPNENELENNNKEDKIYYKTRKDMFMDNPCTKEEYELENLKKQLDWFNHFVDYVGNINSNLYNQACEYADGEQD
tara:strand:+ start:336 stop:596 length:261 start_codon:yes stop_codon:yes gene_type:complete